MDEIRAGRIGIGEIEALEQRQLLQHHRALVPGPGLADRVAAVVVGERRLDRRLPGRHVGAGQDAAMGRAAGVHHVLRSAEAVDGVGHEALRPGAARRIDLMLAAAARALRLAHDPPVGLGVAAVGEQGAGLRHPAARQIDRGRGRPVPAEQLLDAGDGGAGALDQRMALGRVAERRRQHVGERHGAVVAQQQHPGLERAGHAGGEQPGAGHQIEPEPAIMRHAGAGRRQALAADHLDLVPAGVVHDHGDVAARAVEMRLGHLQREGGGHRGIEGVAAALQGAHADRGGDPVGGGDHPESAVDLGAGGEGIGIDVFHGRDCSPDGAKRNPGAAVPLGLLRRLRYRLCHGCPGCGAARSSCGAVLRWSGTVPYAGIWNGPGSAAHH